MDVSTLLFVLASLAALGPTKIMALQGHVLPMARRRLGKDSSVVGFQVPKKQVSVGFPPFRSHNYKPFSTSLFYQNATETEVPIHRFQREASKQREVDEPCILKIHGQLYNMTAWANAHPGGSKILLRFHNKDATKAFEAAHHSVEAHELLKEFRVVAPAHDGLDEQEGSAPAIDVKAGSILSRARHKLFTKEDPVGIHKYLGIFCLLNFIGRYRQMYFGDAAAGLGTSGHPWFPLMCLIPHGLLSVSSLIFDTVPKERVVGKPMIWKEFRVHNIIFGLRSVSTALTAGLASRGILARRVAVPFSCACVLLAQIAADIATSRLRPSQVDSTTATMPYWEGCSLETQKRFKFFYAYSQFLATFSCMAVANPAWALAVLMPIQLASLFLTLVRKGLLSPRGYHYAYTATLVAPYFVGLRSILVTQSPFFPYMAVLGYAMFQARRHGVSKYALWIPLMVARILVGDDYVPYHMW